MNNWPTCPKCGKAAKMTKTKYGNRFFCCGLHSWGGKKLISRENHTARKNAHLSFDRIWKEGLMDRSSAYTWLAKQLRIKKIDCHMGLMDTETANRVISICEEYYGRNG